MSAEIWDGWPPEHGRDGWHWLKRRSGGDLSPWLWEAEQGGPGCGGWLTDDDGDPERMTSEFTYFAPCIPPTGAAQSIAMSDAIQAAVLAERERIAAAIEEEADLCPCEEDAVVLRDTARLVRADFSYDEAERLAEAETKSPV